MTSSELNSLDSSLPLIPVSWGELIDKITILEIKSAYLTDATALADVQREMTLLHDVCQRYLGSRQALVAKTKTELVKINQKLWEVEDALRENERQQLFDDTFISLARSVYQYNDHRAQLKKRINLQLDSVLIEHKSYTPY